MHGLPEKTPGVAAFGGTPPRLDSLRALAELVASPPPEFGDPATADLTGRVLWGLGECGVRADDPTVARAITFLERDACPTGAFWGPWNPPYVAATAFVLIGLARVGADLRGPLAQRALSWLLSVQNRDGGWGESYRAFREPELAGKAPSMPPLTGLVLRALAELTRSKAGGVAAGRAAERAAAYLVTTQAADGTWPDNGYLFTIVPPSQFAWTDFCLSYVLIGLGAWSEIATSATRH